MAETNDFPELSPMALQRQQAMLPGLLAAVRWRRQRRRSVQAAVLLSAIVLVAGLLRPWSSPVPRGNDAPIAMAQPWSTFGDDPTVLTRCEVTAAVRSEWFVDDDGLQDLLAGDDRPSGVVRIGDAVRVPAAAIDRWGSDAP